MSLQTDLDDLQSRLVDRLRSLPGATDFYLFGSRATGEGDAYADIDVQVFTADLAAPRGAWPGFLEGVAPLEVAWPLPWTLDPSSAGLAFVIFFRGESYYHKVDIGLGESARQADFVAAVTPALHLWRQAPAVASSTLPVSEVYIPAPGSVGHLIFDELIGAVRYVKARKRGQHLTCWRFARGRPERWLQLKFEELENWAAPSRTPSTWDIKALDARMGAGERANFLRHLDWSDPRSMDASLVWFTHQIAELLLRKAAAVRDEVPCELVSRQLAFVCDELGLEPLHSMHHHIIALLFDLGDTIMDESTEVKDAEGTTLAAGLIPGMADALRDFKAGGYRLALVADSRPNTPPNVLRQHGLLDLFETLAISEVIGVCKPDARMFRTALDALGIGKGDHGRVAMVGNHLERDIAGANRLGLISIFFHWNERRRTQPLTVDEMPHYTVTSAQELVELVARLP